MNELRPPEEWRYLRAACALIVAVLVVEVAGWLVYRSVHHRASALELTEQCLRSEKLLSLEPVNDDALAATARGGALATRVEGNRVHVMFTRSEDEAAALAAAYLETSGRYIALRLDVRGRVVYVYEGAHSPTQRQNMYDCWYE